MVSVEVFETDHGVACELDGLNLAALLLLWLCLEHLFLALGVQTIRYHVTPLLEP